MEKMFNDFNAKSLPQAENAANDEHLCDEIFERWTNHCGGDNKLQDINEYDYQFPVPLPNWYDNMHYRWVAEYAPRMMRTWAESKDK